MNTRARLALPASACLLLALVGCTSLFGGSSKAAADEHLRAMESQISAGGNHIVDVAAWLHLSGLSHTLHVAVDASTSQITAEQLRAVLGGIADNMPDQAVIVLVAVDDPAGEPVPLAESGRELGLSELQASPTRDTISMHPETLVEMFSSDAD